MGGESRSSDPERKDMGVRMWEDVKSHNQEKHYLQELFLLLKFPQGLRRMDHTKSE